MQAPVLLIGAAHVVDLNGPIRGVLADRTLDAIAVELDAERAHAILNPQPSEPRRGEGPLFVRLWGTVQRRLGEQIGAGVPGAEMKTASDLARERGIPLLLIDDPIRETMGRLLRALSFRERVSLLVGAIVGLIVPSRVIEHQLEDYAEAPADYLEQVRAAYPTIARVLIDERNEHMAGRLATMRANGYGRIAAVVGDAHVPGLSDALRRRAIPVETLAFRELRGIKGPSAGPS